MIGDAPQAFATVYRFKGNKIDVLMATSPIGPFSASATFSTNGPQLVTTTTCPTAKTTTEEFSSDGTTFKLQQSLGNYASVFTFTKQ